jgi:hypothetical protein
MPAKHPIACLSRVPPPQKTRSPFSWRTAILTDQPVKPHKPPFPSCHRRRGVALNEVSMHRNHAGGVRKSIEGDDGSIRDVH